MFFKKTLKKEESRRQQRWGQSCFAKGQQSKDTNVLRVPDGEDSLQEGQSHASGEWSRQDAGTAIYLLEATS